MLCSKGMKKSWPLSVSSTVSNIHQTTQHLNTSLFLTRLQKYKVPRQTVCSQFSESTRPTFTFQLSLVADSVDWSLCLNRNLCSREHKYTEGKSSRSFLYFLHWACKRFHKELLMGTIRNSYSNRPGTVAGCCLTTQAWLQLYRGYHHHCWCKK